MSDGGFDGGPAIIFTTDAVIDNSFGLIGGGGGGATGTRSLCGQKVSR